jgi:AcrR family transcriptional regulator
LTDQSVGYGSRTSFTAVAADRPGFSALPRVVDKQERRSSLVQAALSVFAEHGYHGATMQQVAERAGMSKGGLYEYFSSKDQLLLGTAEAVITEMFEESMRCLEESEGSLRQRVTCHAEHILDQIEGWAELSRSMRQVWAELGDRDDPLGQLLSAQYRQSADRLQQLFDDAVTAEGLDDFPTRPAVLTIMAIVDGLLIQAVIAPEEFRSYSQSGMFPRMCAALIPGPVDEGAS